MTEKSEHIIRREHFVAGVQTGIDSERERIIALLETLRCKDNCPCVANETIDDAIALIKGEQK